MPERPQGLYVEEGVVPSAARTVAGSTDLLSAYGATSTLRLQLNVTASAGTGPTLDVVVEDTLDGTNWNVIGTFAQKSGVGREVINVTTPYADRLRLRWTIGGTGPSYTFSVRMASQMPAAA